MWHPDVPGCERRELGCGKSAVAVESYCHGPRRRRRARTLWCRVPLSSQIGQLIQCSTVEKTNFLFFSFSFGEFSALVLVRTKYERSDGVGCLPHVRRCSGSVVFADVHLPLHHVRRLDTMDVGSTFPLLANVGACTAHARAGLVPGGIVWEVTEAAALSSA